MLMQWTERLWINHCLWIFCAFAGGIAVGPMIPLIWLMALSGPMISLMVFFILRAKNRVFFVWMLIAFFFLGALRYQVVAFLPVDHIAHVFAEEGQGDVFVEGRVIGDVKARSDQQPRSIFYIEVDRLSYRYGQERTVTGKILVRSFLDCLVESGDRVGISGRLHLPYDFPMGVRGSYRAYLKHNDVHVILTVSKKGSIERKENEHGAYGGIVHIRERVKEIINSYLPSRAAGILKAILIGDRTGISNDVRDLFVCTGTAHVLAISGLHMGIMTMIFFIFAGMLPVPLKIKYCIVAAVMIAYMPLAGYRASVLRSGIMVGLFLVSVMIERRFCSLNVLGAAGFLILLFHPMDASSVGFQLSFSATGALIVFAGPFGCFFRNRMPWLSDWIIPSLSVSLSAWLGVAGLVLFHFGMMTPVGLLANFCVVPMMTLVISLGLALVLFGFFHFNALAGVIAIDIEVVMGLMMRISGCLSLLPIGHVSGLSFSMAACLGYYIVLVAWAGGISRKREIRKPSDMRGLSYNT